MKDLNGKIITKGDTVDVPSPQGNETHNNEFRGSVASVEKDHIVVVDGDDEYFCIDANRLSVIDEEAERIETDKAIEKFLAKK